MKLFSSPAVNEDGVTLTHHQMLQPVLSPELTHWWIDLRSWVAESYRLDGRPAIGRFRVVVPVDGLDLSEGLVAAAAAAVIADDLFPSCVEISDAMETLDAVRDRRWAAIQAQRDALNAAPIVVEVGGVNKTFDGSQRSQSLIQGAVAGLDASGRMTVNWTLADDSTVSLESGDVAAVGAAFFVRTSDNWDIARGLREDIYDPGLTTAEEINAITWPA